MTVALPDMTYTVVADNRPAGWIVVLVNVNGPATVIGRWDTKDAAEADALRWMQLENGAAA